MRRNGIASLLTLVSSVGLLLTPLGTTEAGGQLLDSLEKDITELVEKVRPSVVSVVAKCRTPYCGRSLAASTLKKGTSSQVDEFSWRTNVGSGFIMDSRGYIITTENVVRNAQGLEVTLSSGQKYVAQLLGSDPESNIAVLKIDGSRFPPAEMGDSDRVKVGSWVTILGNSFGLSSAVSFGLVNGIREEDDLIQMSAHVSPGNSGAAALNTKGEVIGLVAAAVTEPVTVSIGEPGALERPVQRFDLRSQGASLAIPINRVRKIAAELIEHGEYERGWLGLKIQDMSEDQARKLRVDSGVLVIRVLSSSPAAEAGILRGDVIVKYDSRKVTAGRALIDWVKSTKVGNVVRVTVSRNGREHSMMIKIGKRPKDLEERSGQRVGLSEYDFSPEMAIPPQLTTHRQALQERIEQLQEEIRRLRTLLQKEE
ncbi:MAG: S1C family serine protease [bacterium]